jgi:hypothetical protein
MNALSIRQPWAHLILHGGKDIENRTWPTRVRGRILIHAAKGMTIAEWEDALLFAHRNCGVPRSTLAGDFERDGLPRGGIVGSVEIVDCVRSSASPWFVGDYGFVLRDPIVLPFMPCTGRLGFFDVPYPDSPAGGPVVPADDRPGELDLRCQLNETRVS